MFLFCYHLFHTDQHCQHAEPSLDEFLPVEKQLELEHRQSEEEDALYRKFLQVISDLNLGADQQIDN